MEDYDGGSYASLCTSSGNPVAQWVRGQTVRLCNGLIESVYRGGVQSVRLTGWPCYSSGQQAN